MIFKGLEKKASGRFIHLYNLYYETEDRQAKTYEIVSRDGNIQTQEDLYNKSADSVVLMITDTTGEKILIMKEYRMAMGQWVYNFPAGLIDPGETAEEAGKRELKEETGLDLISIEDKIGIGYNAVGFSNEKSVCLVGTASGKFAKSTSAVEEIEAGWFTKAEVRELLKKYPFAARTQAYCYLWSKE